MAALPIIRARRIEYALAGASIHRRRSAQVGVLSRPQAWSGAVHCLSTQTSAGGAGHSTTR